MYVTQLFYFTILKYLLALRWHMQFLYKDNFIIY